ncbi:hypothetical protein VZT92_018622 [Zoarces viviparus]|uniref:Uncharacterized protein n=1 Tax=Zoarces viviparus TaxID=48416 RepID=A0AAW1EIH6_ZOAVI
MRGHFSISTKGKPLCASRSLVQLALVCLLSQDSTAHVVCSPEKSLKIKPPSARSPPGVGRRATAVKSEDSLRRSGDILSRAVPPTSRPVDSVRQLLLKDGVPFLYAAVLLTFPSHFNSNQLKRKKSDG